MARAPTDPNTAQHEVFLREVDDAVRRSDAESFMRRYGWWVLGAVLALLAAFGGYILWSNSQTAARGKEGEAFVKALDQTRGNAATAQAALAPIAATGSTGYAALATLQQAGLKLDAGDAPAAAALYGKVAADTDIEGPLRDLALIRQTAAEYDSLPPQAVIDRLKPLAVPGNAFFPSAGEMTAIAHMKMGKRDLAGQLFAQIAKEPDIADTMKSRARQMAGVLGIDAVEEKDTLRNDTGGNDNGGNDNGGNDNGAAAQ